MISGGDPLAEFDVQAVVFDACFVDVLGNGFMDFLGAAGIEPPLVLVEDVESTTNGS